MIDVLAKSDLFKGLKDEKIQNVIEHLALKLTFKSGEKIFSSYEKPKYMYILLRGDITVFRENYLGGRELLKDFDTPGELFGEVYLYLDIDYYDFTCQCESDVEVLAISREFFDELFSFDMKIAQTITTNYIKILSEKTFFFNQKTRTMSGSTIRVKLARYIIDHASEDTVRLNFNREGLADYLGITRPSLSRELNSMKRDGLIDLDSGIIIIKDSDELEKFY